MGSSTIEDVRELGTQISSQYGLGIGESGIIAALIVLADAIKALPQS